MKHYLKEIRRIMLASVRMDGAYYFFSKRMGIKENILNLLYACLLYTSDAADEL